MECRPLVICVSKKGKLMSIKGQVIGVCNLLSILALVALLGQWLGFRKRGQGCKETEGVIELHDLVQGEEDTCCKKENQQEKLS